MGTFKYSEILKSVYHQIAKGGQYRAIDLLPLVQTALGLSDEQMKEMTKGENSPRVKKYVQWALTHLYGAGLIIRVKRGLYAIAPQQQQLLQLNDYELEQFVMSIFNSREKDASGSYVPDSKTIVKVRELLPKLTTKGYDWMQSILFLDTAPDMPTIRKSIRSLLVDADEDISLEELQDILKEVAELRSIQYELVVRMENRGNKREPRIQTDICVKDNKGKEYPLELGTMQSAIYLTFLYLEDSVSILDFCSIKEHPNIVFQKIYHSLYNKKGSAKAITYDEKEDKDAKRDSAQATLVQYISKIRTMIADALPNDKTARQFVIADNEDDDLYSIKATNPAIRNSIKKEFNLK